MEDLLDANRRQWDERTQIHVGSAFYDVAGFKAGRCTLKSVEVGELGDVSGKRLLHLQCHFGLDTLSWARRGAQATGVDFSGESIVVAEQLAADLSLGARFVRSDIYDLPNNLDGRFDIVFASYGVLVWLPDLTRWAETVAHFLDDDGVFYIVDAHPLGRVVVEDGGRLIVEDPYFATGRPEEVPALGTYADPTTTLANRVSYQWQHALSEIVSALANAGLRIEFLHEFPFSESPRLPSMQLREDGYWHLVDGPELPFLFSLRARKT